MTTEHYWGSVVKFGRAAVKERLQSRGIHQVVVGNRPRLNLPGTGQSGLAALLDRARRPQHRIWADGAPFALKDVLKRRGYRWNDGTDGRPKSWYVDVDDTGVELDFLRKQIFQKDDMGIVCRTITSLDRFSNRV